MSATKWKFIVLKTVHYYANSRFDWLISAQQSVNPFRETISMLSGKYKEFTFVDKRKSFVFLRKNRNYFPGRIKVTYQVIMILFLNNNLLLKIPPLINLLWKTLVNFNKMIVDTPFQR